MIHCWFWSEFKSRIISSAIVFDSSFESWKGTKRIKERKVFAIFISTWYVILYDVWISLYSHKSSHQHMSLASLQKQLHFVPHRRGLYQILEVNQQRLWEEKMIIWLLKIIWIIWKDTLRDENEIYNILLQCIWWLFANVNTHLTKFYDLQLTKKKNLFWNNHSIFTNDIESLNKNFILKR